MTITAAACNDRGITQSSRFDTVTTPNFVSYFQRSEVQQWMNNQLMAGYIVRLSAAATE